MSKQIASYILQNMQFPLLLTSWTMKSSYIKEVKDIIM